MPKDKSASHEKIVKAAMKEFQEKGFACASLKAVADEVGMTSAAMYRHFASKQDMFRALVQPAIDELEDWIHEHVHGSYELLDDKQFERMWDFDDQYNDARIVLDVMYKQPEAFRLLLFCAEGTPYSNFLNEYVEETTDTMMTFQKDCEAEGLKPKLVTRDEMYMLIYAYITALVQPLKLGYSKEEAESYLKTVIEFFTPGWRMITGI